ncbi:hypothetical protein [Parapedobacter sp. DT-150]|uniref:hypothetical protein n=1 Tax=Parapedobacter sp. DT-150 TaxID=3396162 RepID=UPI003F1BFAE4
MALSVWTAFAQDQADQAKYELIRETINFLATDKAVSKDTTFRISCETLDYDCFGQQLSSNPVAGIERWYNSWRSMTVANETQLVALRDQVAADIFDRPGKGYRKQLAGYEEYVSRIDGLIDQYANGGPVADTAVDTAQAPLLSPDESNPTDPEQLTDRNDNAQKNDIMIAYLALAIGIIALIIAALPILRKKEQQLPAELQGLPYRLEELTVWIKRLEQQKADPQVKDAIASLTDIMESIEKRVVELENKE